MKVGVFDSVGGNVERYDWCSGRFPELELIPFRGVHPGDCLEKIRELGCEALLFVEFTPNPPELFRDLAGAGVRYIATISVGHEHMDLKAMEQYGIRGANVPAYSPNSVAEYAVMMLLACCRNLRHQLRNTDRCRYRLDFPAGREIRDLTIGVVGAGRIGSVTIECLSGFHPKKIYANTRRPGSRWGDKAEYADLETIYAECDAILYHADVNPSTLRMLNRDAIAKMKDGVILINPSRGGLVDTEALLEGIESGKIGALGMDVIDNEALLRSEPSFDTCPIPVLGRLLEHENVVFTPHTAYYTEVANRDLELTTIENLAQYAREGKCEHELTGLDA